MIINTDWEIGLEIQEQNLNTQMNPLPRANQAGRSNPVKVTRIPFLRRVTVLQVSFQSFRKYIYQQPKHPGGQRWEGQQCPARRQHSLWLPEKQCNNSKLPWCHLTHHWALRTLCKKKRDIFIWHFWALKTAWFQMILYLALLEIHLQ